MTPAIKQPGYVVVSPVKDEERHVERTLESMTAQSLRPVLWVIVDDGSTDRTPGILSRYAADHPWIRVIRKPASGARQVGSRVIEAFNLGYDAAREVDHGFLVKLDCDLSFGADYFEKLLERFQREERLGIASGMYLEASICDQWEEISMPAYHAAGASKVIRRECFEQIGGFVSSRGWDTVDEIRAMTRGWRTTHFRDLQMRHWKIEGSGVGQWRTNMMHGEIHYLTGGGLIFFALKAAHRATRRPQFIGALGLVWGFTKCFLARKPRLVTKTEARYYSSLLNRRITSRLGVRNTPGAGQPMPSTSV